VEARTIARTAVAGGGAEFARILSWLGELLFARQYKSTELRDTQVDLPCTRIRVADERKRQEARVFQGLEFGRNDRKKSGSTSETLVKLSCFRSR
jgi:hypothetical protein